MPLTALGIKKAGDGRHGDSNGLSLYKKGDSGKWMSYGRTWVMRVERAAYRGGC